MCSHYLTICLSNISVHVSLFSVFLGSSLSQLISFFSGTVADQTVPDAVIATRGDSERGKVVIGSGISTSNKSTINNDHLDQLSSLASISVGVVSANQVHPQPQPPSSLSLATNRNIDKDETSIYLENEQFTCPTQFGHYRDTNNCAAYYICSFGLSIHKNCSIGLYFSERLQICDWPTNVPCERGKCSTIEQQQLQ